MKPTKLPKRFEAKWSTWPTLEDLHARDRDLKLHAVRALLAPVPCYRCADNSVRYEPELADLALSGQLDEEEAEAGERDSELGSELSQGKLVDVMVLCRELARMVTDARKEKNEHIKAMESPMKTGVAMMERAMDVMAKRLEHYDELWDGMIATAERLQSQASDRELEAKKQERNHEARKDVFAFAKQQLPAVIANVRTTLEAKAALDLLRSVPVELVDGLMDGDMFTDEQKAWMRTARGPAKQPPREQAANQNANHQAPHQAAAD